MHFQTHEAQIMEFLLHRLLRLASLGKLETKLISLGNSFNLIVNSAALPRHSIPERRWPAEWRQELNTMNSWK